MKRIVSVILALVFVCLAAVACANIKNYNTDEYIKLAEYKNIPAVTVKSEVTEEAVQEQIMAAINYYSRKVEVTDRPAQIGDIVTVNYAGYVDGVSENAVTVSGVEIPLGLGSMPEEFENALVGLGVGETTFVTLTLPEPFAEYPDYAGKVAELAVVVMGISVPEAPSYTDDFVRAYLKHNSIAEFEQAVRDALEAKQKQAYYDVVAPKVWDVITENTEVIKYPEAEVKEYYDALVGSVSDYVEALNLDFDAFVEKNLEMTADEFYAKSMEEAQMRVKDNLITKAIAKAEGIKVTSDIYEERALKYATDVYDCETIEELESKFSREEIEDIILTDLVHEFVADNASITYSNEN